MCMHARLRGVHAHVHVTCKPNPYLVITPTYGSPLPPSRAPSSRAASTATPRPPPSTTAAAAAPSSGRGSPALSCWWRTTRCNHSSIAPYPHASDLRLPPLSPQAALAVATAVPFFDDLTSLIGALQTPLVGFCIPAALYACGRHRTYVSPRTIASASRRPLRQRQAPFPT